MSSLWSVLEALKSRGGVVYTTICLATIVVVALPLTIMSIPVGVSRDQAMVQWVVVGFLLPVLETWLLQDCLQEALCRRGMGRRWRVGISWVAFAVLHVSSMPKLLLVGGVQGFLYAATYAVWRPEGRGRAFAAVLYLHLLANNLLLWMPMLLLADPEVQAGSF